MNTVWNFLKVMPLISKIYIEARSCECDVCHHTWISIAKEIPKCCANMKCRSREWNGKKIKRQPQPTVKIELPKPRRSRLYGYATDSSDVGF